MLDRAVAGAAPACCKSLELELELAGSALYHLVDQKATCRQVQDRHETDTQSSRLKEQLYIVAMTNPPVA